MPKLLASIHFSGSGSIPRTLHPFNKSNFDTRIPINPRPLTKKVSPKRGFASLIPCKPIEAKTVSTASSSETESGILHARFLGTKTISE